MPEPSPAFGFSDWEIHPQYGYAFITIVANTPEGVGMEIATIIHHVTPAHPLDGPAAQRKLNNAQAIVALLNGSGIAATAVPTEG